MSHHVELEDDGPSVPPTPGEITPGESSPVRDLQPFVFELSSLRHVEHADERMVLGMPAVVPPENHLHGGSQPGQLHVYIEAQQIQVFALQNQVQVAPICFSSEFCLVESMCVVDEFGKNCSGVLITHREIENGEMPNSYSLIAKDKYKCILSDPSELSECLSRLATGGAVRADFESRYEVNLEIYAGPNSNMFLIEDGAQAGQPFGGSLPDKVLKRSPFACPSLLREFRTLRRLQHPYIGKMLELYELGPERLHWGLTMEYLSGNDLFERVANGQRFNEFEAVEIMVCVFSAISYVHSCEIMHRDLKPENLVFATPDCNDIRVVDFGLATSIYNEQEKKMFCGSPGYVAPEILRSREYSLKVDCFSLGAVLYFCIQGKGPFAAPTVKETLTLNVTNRVSFRDAVWQGVSRECLKLIHHLMRLKANERCSSKTALQYLQRLHARRSETILSAIHSSTEGPAQGLEIGAEGESPSNVKVSDSLNCIRQSPHEFTVKEQSDSSSRPQNYHHPLRAEASSKRAAAGESNYHHPIQSQQDPQCPQDLQGSQTPNEHTECTAPVENMGYSSEVIVQSEVVESGLRGKWKAYKEFAKARHNQQGENTPPSPRLSEDSWCLWATPSQASNTSSHNSSPQPPSPLTEGSEDSLIRSSPASGVMAELVSRIRSRSSSHGSSRVRKVPSDAGSTYSTDEGLQSPFHSPSPSVSEYQSSGENQKGKAPKKLTAFRRFIQEVAARRPSLTPRRRSSREREADYTPYHADSASGYQ